MEKHCLFARSERKAMGNFKSVTGSSATLSGHRQRVALLTNATPSPHDTRLSIVASFTPSRLMHACFRGGLKSPHIVQEGVNEATILSLVSCGLGGAFVSRASASLTNHYGVPLRRTRN